MSDISWWGGGSKDAGWWRDNKAGIQLYCSGCVYGYKARLSRRRAMLHGNVMHDLRWHIEL